MTKRHQEIKLALTTKDEKEQKMFLFSFDSSVRKALACNNNISKEIANKLLFDKTLNVSYFASKNKNCTMKRVFPKEIEYHSCLNCLKELEDKSECEKC